MQNVKLNQRGIALPMVIGLVSLLMLASVAANEMVIRALRSVHYIEAADRAYFAAEAGIEDALYELSPHFAGYETPDIPQSPGSADETRKTDFGGNVQWANRWAIGSHDEKACAEWGDDTENLCGKFYENQKLIISLFNDESAPTDISNNAINTVIQPTDINTINITGFSITFRLPTYIVDENSGSFPAGLTIDNDGDMGITALANGINEDGKVPFAGPAGDYVSNKVCNSLPGKDDDCDGRENEDSPEDTVIYWKISDGAGNTFSPVRGCMGDGGSEICEKDFVLNGNELSFTLDGAINGVCEGSDICAGSPSTINDFLSAVAAETDRKLQIEFNIVAPLEQADAANNTKIAIPYLEYGIDYDGGGTSIPTPYFTIKSDGYYQDFKQSITSTVMPKTAVPLFDFTIIQQQ
jgi:hypothetical protein